jgi:hypothetical protein
MSADACTALHCRPLLITHDLILSLSMNQHIRVFQLPARIIVTSGLFDSGNCS